MTRALLALLCLLTTSAPALAASQWSEAMGAKARLLTGAEDGAGAIWAGIEIRLEPGWKTYWRTPGASGIPPRIDFSASRNLAAAEIHWPAPARFGEGDGEGLGYSEAVVLPVRIEPRDPAAPVELVLAMDYGVCEALCVPAEAAARATLDGRGPDQIALMRALARVPARQPLPAADGAEGVSSVAAGATTLTLETTGEADDVIVEAADGRYLGKPVRQGARRFTLGLARGLEPGTALTFTTLFRGRAVEQSWRTPPAPAK